ncbi:MAG: LamG domain-containing protein [Candidatus Micrarchaeales archaeon]|nr:LamG domain-containing protein [Candidatus Micrarchaeales archaeon]
MMNGRAQSAIEYLTTYVWALILISIVAVILFFFSGYGNVPPSGIGGACVAFRPNGPGTLPIFLQGVCNDAEPKYVASLLSPTSAIDTPLAFSSNTIATTVSAWVKINETAGNHPVISSTWTLAENGGELWFYACTGGGFTNGSSFHAGSIQNNTWAHVVVTLAPTTPPNENVTLYINGVKSMSNTTVSGLSVGSDYLIGSSVTCGAGQFNGYIANMQIYNTVLSPSQVRALFEQGIGGIPISINSLSAWYQFNGDTTDYSGNGENATASSSTFTQSWQSGYN